MTIGRTFTSKHRIAYHAATPIIITGNMSLTNLNKNILDYMRIMEAKQLKQSVRLCKAVVSIELKRTVTEKEN
jgi:hypothetical protein